ncbi:unnamed protein product [Allacma fusca]|uniref:Cuticle protein CPCFC domain-containing protein n=1 Tax=Allacma fusca TaxID=39272 RepID=A0A8J2K5U3_9HEXA|nr:unnamed protein product [Allacma fusca]
MSKALLVVLLLAFVAISFAQERYPAGVSPASCPNYPFCNVAGNGAPAGYVFDRVNHQYPAGVHPAACPSYPYC